MKAALVFFPLATPAFAQNKQADTSVAIAQQQPSIVGDYSGFLGPLHLFCTLDSLDQNSLGMECTEIVEKKNDFSFKVPVVHGKWNGRLSEDGNTLVGDWSQGLPVVLVLKKQPRLL